MVTTQRIPLGVWYSVENDNFYRGDSGQGALFYQRWKDAWESFPDNRTDADRICDEAIKVTIEIGRHPVLSERDKLIQKLGALEQIIKTPGQPDSWRLERLRAINGTV